jgi:hypothetical protein
VEGPAKITRRGNDGITAAEQLAPAAMRILDLPVIADIVGPAIIHPPHVANGPRFVRVADPVSLGRKISHAGDWVGGATSASIGRGCDNIRARRTGPSVEPRRKLQHPQYLATLAAPQTCSQSNHRRAAPLFQDVAGSDIPASEAILSLLAINSADARSVKSESSTGLRSRIIGSSSMVRTSSTMLPSA